MVIQDKGNFGSHLSNTTTENKKDEVAFQTWKAKNLMVMTWLVNSMEPKIGQTFVFINTKEIWDAVNETFLGLGNSA